MYHEENCVFFLLYTICQYPLLRWLVYPPSESTHKLRNTMSFLKSLDLLSVSSWFDQAFPPVPFKDISLIRRATIHHYVGGNRNQGFLQGVEKICIYYWRKQYWEYRVQNAVDYACLCSVLPVPTCELKGRGRRALGYSWVAWHTAPACST